MDQTVVHANRAQIRSRSEGETQARRDLAAAYRLVAHFGMTDLIYTHISARIPGSADIFLINRYGLLFDEITASSLVAVDTDGNALDPADINAINPAGFTIHSAVHMARPEIACVIHTHTIAGMAVSAQETGLLPITQHAMRFYGHLSYHDYEGVALDLAERERLIADLGNNKAMILRNHGVLLCGETVAEAYQLMHMLERACQAQVQALSGGTPLRLPPEAVRLKTAEQFNRNRDPKRYDKLWSTLLRMVEREYPNYAD